MTQIEMHVMAVGALKRAAFGQLLHMTTRKNVAGTQFHLAMGGLISRRPEAVVLKVAVAVFVFQPSTFAPRGLRNQNAGAWQARGMVLNKLHVFQRDACAIGRRHSIPGIDRGVGGEREDTTAASRAEDHSFADDRFDSAGIKIDGCNPAHLTIVDQQRGEKALVIADDVVILEGSLKKRVQQMKSRLVGREKGSIDAHSAEGSGADAAVGVATPGTAPVLKLDKLSRSLLDKSLDGILVGDKIGSKNGVLRMQVEAIILAKNCRGSALGGNRVASHRIDFRD